MERTILHSDLNSFYASVECLHNPAIRDKPVSVCGSVDDRHGIVLASNQIAKRFGIRTGDAVWQAKQKCRELVIAQPHMNWYIEFSKAARAIYGEYSPNVEAFGLDENWIDLTGAEHLFGSGQEVADTIRRRIKQELGVTVSIGVSFNKVFSKLGSDYKKPDATTLITKENYKNIVWTLPVSDLLYVGRATTEKLNRVGIFTVGDLARADADFLKFKLGKWGTYLWRYANGIDDAPVCEAGANPIPVKSIGNSTTTPRDLENRDDIRVTTMLLSEAVAERLRSSRFKCRVVQVYIRYANLASYERQEKLPFPCCTAQRIGNLATDLILGNWTGAPLRSIGVRACNLVPDDFPQLSIFHEESEEFKQEDLERAMQDVRRRFGHFSIQRGIMLADRKLSDLDAQRPDSAQSVAFYRGG